MTFNDDKPMTRDQFSQLLAHQYGGCAICGKESQSLQLDHDHRTTFIRGLLCRDCNRSLDEYEKKRLRYKHYEAYLQDPPMKVMGLNIPYKPAQLKDKAS